MKYNVESIEQKLIAHGKLFGISLNLKDPVTIQDKIAWLKVHDSTPLKTRCADKILVHEYCKEKLGKDICIPIIKVYNSANEIDWNELPDKFAIKCNHGSGMNIIVNDKSKLDKKNAVSKLDKWMKTDFSTRNGCELHYHDIVRKIFVEEFKAEEGKSDITDYKVWCFNGSPKFIQVMNGRSTDKYANHYDLEWNYFDAKRSNLKTNPNKLDNKPKNLNLMIEYSKKLSADFMLVRVDFYEINGELYLGELTFTPNSGIIKFSDKSQSIKYGNMLKLKKEKCNEEKGTNNTLQYAIINGMFS